ncbi:MAG: O-antigen ligase family protein [Phyllobacteriaceae bacterium]|nr:O-antigen ligase family protein [Phyllobacteriaceae bacterium]
MNSIASPKRTDLAAGLSAATARALGVVLAATMLTILLISFKPYQIPPQPGQAQTGGDIVNQLGFSALGMIGLLALLSFADRRRVIAIPGIGWAAMIGFLALATLAAADPSASLRTLAFTLFAMLAMASVVALARDGDGLSTILLSAGAVVLVLSYGGLIVFPDLARHTAESVEYQHAGLWRGVFTHKNITGPVMASFGFAGIYLFRRGWRWSGALLALFALAFMANTGSKTTLGTVPLVALLVIAPGLVGLRRLTPALIAVALGIGALATIGIVFIPYLKQLAHDLAPELTYTGRTQLWSHAGEMIAKAPWRGYGFESFWGAPIVTESDRYFDQDWDFALIVHGHDGYLDIALTMGLPALAMAIAVLLIAPLIDYMRTPLIRENVLAADFFMMVLAFGALNALLESFFFRRADPVWLLFFMAVVGLRVTARQRMVAREA